MLRGNIAAPSLEILWKNLNSVKCYDKSNMNVFTLSQCENFRRGLIYFDQFINLNTQKYNRRMAENGFAPPPPTRDLADISYLVEN